MADNQYKIELGVKLDTNDLKTEIAKIDGKHKVKLGVDLGVKDIQDRIKAYNSNTNNIKVKLKATLDTDDLKKQINSINLSGKGKGIAVPIDATSLNSSLEKIESAVIDIKKAFGSLDNSNTKSLVSSVNLIANALEKATNESNGLIASLSALSKKDFSVNIGVASKSNPISKNLLYGDKVKEIFPQLQQQKDAIIKYLQKYYEDIYAAEIQARKSAGNRKSIQKGSKVHSTDPLSIISDLTGVDINKAWDLFEKTSAPLKTTGKNKDNFKDRINEINDLINSLMKGAEAKGIDLSSVVSEFSTSSNELVKSASDIQTGVKETEESFEKLKQILNGGGIDADGLGEVLKPISQDLAEIKKAFESLSSIGTIDGLTASFKDLSEVLDKLISNVAIVKNALGDGLNTTVSDSGTEKEIQGQKELAQASTRTSNTVAQNEKRKQQEFRATANESQRLSDEAEALKKDINFNDASIDSMKQSFQELGIAIDSVTVNLRNGSLDSFTIKGTDGIERTVTATQKLDDELVKVTQSFAKANSQADKIEFKIDTGKFTSQITKVTSDFNKLSLKSDDIKTDINQLNAEFANMQTAVADGDINALVNAYKEYERILESVNNKLDINRIKQQEANRQQKQGYDVAKLEQDKKNFALEVDYYLKNNTAAAKEFGAEIRRIRVAIDTCDDSSALNNLKAQFRGVKSEANVALKSTQTFGDKIKKQWQQYSTYFGVASIFQYAEQGLRSMFEQVKLIDSAMTELKKVTNETDAAYDKFLGNAANRAKEIGTTIDGLVSSTADFARLGYGFEDAQGLAEVANIYAVVGDEIEGVEGATESLISTMAAFKDEMNGMSNTDFAMSIIDKFNEIGNNFAISSGGIGEALERSASSLMAANNTIDESIALITAANTVVQDPTAVGKDYADIKSGYIG